MRRLAIKLKRLPWPLRVARRAYLRHLIRWVDTDIAADQQLLRELPRRIREHERFTAALRVELALLED